MASVAIGGLGCAGLVAAAALADPAPERAPVYRDHGASSMSLPPSIPDADSGSIITGQPFEDPPIIASGSSDLAVTLTSSAQPVRISGKLMNGRVYAASSQGVQYPASYMPPVLRLRRGQRLIINLENRLPEGTNIHTHGFFISPKGNQDDVFEHLLVGGNSQHVYTNTQHLSPGSYWFHPHLHPLVEEQVFGGMSGLIDVQGLRSMLPSGLRTITEHYVGLKDFQVMKGVNTIPLRDINSQADTNRTVNGMVQPVMTMAAGETQLWHMGNIGADIWYDIQASGLKVWVIAEDGNPVVRPYQARDLLMPPARRFDLLVQAPKAGTFKLITRKMSTGPQGDSYPRTLLATVNVTGAGTVPVAAVPKTYGTEIDLSKAGIARHRIFRLSENGAGTKFFINGKPWPGPNRMSASPVTGTVEQWTFTNSAGEEHPIHIHVNDMQVMSINGVKQDTDSWVDTIPVPAAKDDRHPGTVVMRMAFRTYTGPYVFHCHILAHEDNGMMNNVNVTSPAATGSLLASGPSA